MQNRFTSWDGSDVYDWHVNQSNPDGEEPLGRERQLTREASSGGLVGGIVQQGDEGPMTIKYSGTIFHQAQYDRMWDFYVRSRTETIMFRDFTGQEMEVMFTSFMPKRRGTLRNPRDPANCPNWYWTYTLEMEIMQIFSGPLAGKITP